MRILDVLGLASIAALAFMYLHWPTNSFVEAEDSLRFILHIKNSWPYPYDPNHLLFEPINSLAAQMLNRWSASVVMQTLTSVFALIGLLGTYVLVEPKNGKTAALISVWLIATTFGYWHYGKVADAYIPALALAIWSIVLFDRIGHHPTRTGVILMAIVSSAAVLIHQLYIVLSVLMFVMLLIDRHRGARDALLFAALGGSIVGGAYVFAYLGNEFARQNLGFIGWSLGHASGGLWDDPDSKTPIKAAMGIFRVFVPLPSILVWDGVASAAQSAIGAQRIAEELFLTRNALSSQVAKILPALSIIYCVAFIGLFSSGFRDFFSRSPNSTKRLLVSAICLYTVLVLAWEASNNEFWIHIVAFSVLAFGSYVTFNRQKILFSAATVTLAFVVNFSAGIYPLSKKSNDFWHVQTASITDRVPANGLIITDCVWICRSYFRNTGHRYFFVSTLDDYEYVYGIQYPTAGEPFYLTEWALEPLFGKRTSDQALRQKNIDRLEADFGALPEIAQSNSMRPIQLWRWDGDWEELK